MPLSLIPVIRNIGSIANNSVNNLARSIKNDRGNLALTAINIGNKILSEKLNRASAGIGSPLNGITGVAIPGNFSNLSGTIQNFVQPGNGTGAIGSLSDNVSSFNTGAIGSLSDSVGSFTQTGPELVENIASGIGTGFSTGLGNNNEFNVLQNLVGDVIGQARSRNIPSAEVLELGTPESVVEVYPSSSGDWRIKVASPFGTLTWPTTPTLTLSTKANYNNQDIVHSNFPHPVYRNSASDDITISGEWPCETEADAIEWIASMTIGRSLTKMDFAGTGAPPVICTLSGYGSTIPNIPVVVKSFSVDLKDDVHYISVASAHVPRLSTVSIIVMPIYSRAAQRQFDLGSYAAGGGNIPF
jgi:hypothetical protein